MSFFMALGTAISAYSAIQEGKAAKADSQRQAALYEQDRRMNDLETQQRHNDRLAQFDSAQASNEAFFSFAGRDSSDRSVKAFLARQKEIAYTDVGRSDTQGFARDAQISFQRDMTLARGRAEQQASYMKAGSSIVSGLYKYQQVKVD